MSETPTRPDTRATLIRRLPVSYPDLEPHGSHKHEPQHELRLKCRPGQSNQYFARWHHSRFSSDTESFEEIADVWSDLEPVLNLHRC